LTRILPTKFNYFFYYFRYFKFRFFNELFF